MHSAMWCGSLCIAALSILHHRTHQLYWTPGYIHRRTTPLLSPRTSIMRQLAHNALPFASNSIIYSDVISLNSPTPSTAPKHRLIEPTSSIPPTWDSPWTQVELISKTRRPDPVLHDAYFPHYFTLLLHSVITKAKNFATLLMIILALLQAGDFHPNPGPLSDLLQIIAEKNHTQAFNIPHIYTFPHKNFDFESFFIDPVARPIVKEKCFNIIYSCSAHPNLNDCFAIFTKFYVKHSVALSNIVTTTITECLLGYWCAYCL